jgi:RNA polymerase sigma factor (sigma-70 family)
VNPESSPDVSQELPFVELLQALRDADEATWNRVFDRLLPRATAAVRRELGAAASRPENVGGEAVASACRTFYRNLTAGKFTLESWSDLSGLFIRITLNKCLDSLRRRSREAPVTDLVSADGSEAPPDLLADLPARDPLPLDDVLRREADAEFKRVVDLVRRRFGRKNEQWRAIFNLKLEGTCTNEQIAHRLCCSERAVKRVWQEALELLRQLHNGTLNEDDTGRSS